MQKYTDMIAKVAPGVDPRHILALLQAPGGGCGLDDLTQAGGPLCGHGAGLAFGYSGRIWWRRSPESAGSNE